SRLGGRRDGGRRGWERVGRDRLGRLGQGGATPGDGAEEPNEERGGEAGGFVHVVDPRGSELRQEAPDGRAGEGGRFMHAVERAPEDRIAGGATLVREAAVGVGR